MLTVYDGILEREITAAPTRATHNVLMLQHLESEIYLLAGIQIIVGCVYALVAGALWAQIRRDAEEARVILVRLVESH